MAEPHKLLVVDDEPDILLIVVRALQKDYYQIDSFNDPVKALAQFEKHAGEYSLVLSDIRMPGMSGMEFLNFVKRIRPNIPIMAMTAYSTSDGDISKAVPWIKEEDIMHKPFKTADICNAVKKALRIEP